MHIQFDIDEILWGRASKYISKENQRNIFALMAFEEWVTRREGRDKKYQTERLISDKNLLRPIVKSLLDE